ncbi:WxcM-like domain-containing protein [Chryseobacterium sp. JUb7]|uniref:WxcM-like domain-containing protein n=1 Tax=Chryseobacterium sp. JUb7 TaxID=2940599 RepID=UPI0021685942|nr:WxcM-like domain-containing protein [Chryseobacterium sp. JUb7]MCS3531766.1 dTDP-4-dehydrorhamnose 3,5-epimerase-like enzyme [Chryseobacterium sp. JUb7]
MEIPKIIKGGKYSDERGNLFFNNEFDASAIKRIYYIENTNIEFVRGWTGHQIEQRWFSAIQGSFNIKLIKIDNWEAPSKKSEILEFKLSSDTLNIIHIPKGYVTAIQAIEKGSKLLVMADYSLGEIVDVYRFPIDYFEKLK